MVYGAPAWIASPSPSRRSGTPRPRDILAWSRRAEELGYAGVFIPESFNDSLAYAQAVAAATTRVRVGTAITNVYLRHPTLLAQQAAAVQEFSGGRLVLGLGVGHRAVNEPLGIDMGDPLGKMRDVIGVLRAAWAKGPHQPRPASPPRDPRRGARARRMIELAGELADGVIFNLFPLARYPPRDGRRCRAGAARGGRDAAALEVCHFTTCYLVAPTAPPRCTRRSACSRATRTCPSTATCSPRAASRAEVEAVRAAWRARDVAAAEAAVSDAMADAVTLVGDPDALPRAPRARTAPAGATLHDRVPEPGRRVARGRGRARAHRAARRL